MRPIKTLFIILVISCLIVGYYIYLNGQRNLTLKVNGAIVVPEELVFTPETTQYSINKQGQIIFNFYDSQAKHFECLLNKKSYSGWITPEINAIINYKNDKVASSESVSLILPFYKAKNRYTSNEEMVFILLRHIRLVL